MRGREKAPRSVNRPAALRGAFLAVIESRDLVATIEDAAGLATPTSARSLPPWLESAESDPLDTTNVATERPADVERLKTRLARWRSELRKTEPLLFESVDDKTTKGLKALGYLD